MDTNPVTSTSATNSNDLLTKTATKTKDLDQMAFPKLLITPLQNQDPTNPTDDSQFIAQLAQFSSLEQMTNMSKGLNDSSNNQAATRAFAMIGRDIDYTDPSLEGTQSGIVASVSFVDGLPKLNVNSSTVEVSNVTQVY